MPGSSPGMTIFLFIKPLTAMAGLGPAIHETARPVRLRGRWS
jgi:hypothetical protein